MKEDADKPKRMRRQSQEEEEEEEESSASPVTDVSLVFPFGVMKSAL